jgi:transposase-like protein
MARKNLFEARLAQLREGRWARTDAELVLDALERSGDSVAGFARTHGLSAPKLFWWRSQLSSEPPPVPPSREAESLSFAPVVVTGLGRAPAAVVRQGALEIDILDPSKVEASWLASVLRAANGSET